MEAGSALDRTPLRGFKDFYQYASTTRVIAGRELLSSTGFEFQKEGGRRVFVVTDEVVRGTGLVDRVEAGVVDGGLEVVGVYDREDPTLFGFPFFYWFQFALIPFASAFTYVAFRLVTPSTKRRPPAEGDER